MQKVFLILGTRPEAIKMVPVYRALQKSGRVDVKIVSTGQHREMLDQVLSVFNVVPTHDLAVMEAGQSLSRLTARILEGLDRLFASERPDMVLVHGDTTTSFSASLACFYHGIPFAHVEAGLRTHRLDSPFPEEFNRQMITKLASFHFAPTPGARDNLLAQGIPPDRIAVTGNTVVDALLSVLAPRSVRDSVAPVVITLHRRESFGGTALAVLKSLKQVVLEHAQIPFIFPVHSNPRISRMVEAELGDLPNLHLRAPLAYPDFISLIDSAQLVVTDSGGLQEEATLLGKMVLVVRNVTERPAGDSGGCARMVGTTGDALYQAMTDLLSQKRSPAPPVRPSARSATAAPAIAAIVVEQLLAA